MAVGQECSLHTATISALRLHCPTVCRVGHLNCHPSTPSLKDSISVRGPPECCPPSRVTPSGCGPRTGKTTPCLLSAILGYRPWPLHSSAAHGVHSTISTTVPDHVSDPCSLCTTQLPVLAHLPHDLRSMPPFSNMAAAPTSRPIVLNPLVLVCTQCFLSSIVMLLVYGAWPCLASSYASCVHYPGIDALICLLLALYAESLVQHLCSSARHAGFAPVHFLNPRRGGTCARGSEN